MFNKEKITTQWLLKGHQRRKDRDMDK